MSTQEQEGLAAESLVRDLIEAWARAICAKDIERVMSVYAQDLCSFDLDPPLRYTRADNKRRAWSKFFAAFPGSVSYVVNELNVCATTDMAYVHSLNHVTGRHDGGQVSDLWVRWTACLRRFDGVWLIVHDHASVPADVSNGRALVDLTP